MDSDDKTEPITLAAAVGAPGPPSGETVPEPGDDATGPSTAAPGPATASGTKAKKRPDPSPDGGPFFTEVWHGRAIYRCPLCRVAKTDRDGLSGDAAVRLHLERRHAPATTPEERARAAGLVIPKR